MHATRLNYYLIKAIFFRSIYILFPTVQGKLQQHLSLFIL